MSFLDICLYICLGCLTTLLLIGSIITIIVLILTVKREFYD